MNRLVVLYVLVGMTACDGGEPPDREVPAPSAEPRAPAEAAPEAEAVEAPEAEAAQGEAVEAPEAEAPEAEAPEAEAVDLLHAVPATVVLSSAYRDESSQGPRLVDGDLGTAWNSRTGDLAGAWIEVHLPEEATVSSIAMTSGFTRTRQDTDLFLGNHRVARVRVLHDGAPVGVFPLDVSRRDLQRLPVRGGGGVYRIEVLEVVPGTRERWREVCVSELRVMGRAPGAEAGTRSPEVRVGSSASPGDAAGGGAAERGVGVPLADPALERRIRDGLAEAFGEDLIGHVTVFSLGTPGGEGGRWRAFEVRAEDVAGETDGLYLVAGAPEVAGLPLFAIPLGEAHIEPGAEGFARLDSFRGLRMDHGVLRAELSVVEGFAEFATCTSCRQRREEPTLRRHATLLCAELDEEQTCVLVPTGLEVVSPGVEIDDDGRRLPYDDEAPPPAYRLRLRLADGPRAHVELVSGRAGDEAQERIGDRPLEELGDLATLPERLD